jgi:NAD(P)-dependent dehydrogenase (short-subunit alcohol dehydrogenase family)
LTARRVALVTGGTRGIGEAIVRRLAGDGFAVVLTGRTQESADRAVERLRADGLEVRGIGADARRETDAKAAIAFVGKEHSRLDVLVNNAGIGSFDRVDRLAAETFEEVLQTNLFGVFYAIRNAVPLMKASGGGIVVNIGSLASVNAFAGGAAYNASKFGLLGLSDAAMLDLRHEGIRVAIVLPGSVATEFMHSGGRPSSSWMLTPDDVAEAVADLVRFPDRAIASRIDLRPSRPPQK